MICPPAGSSGSPLCWRENCSHAGVDVTLVVHQMRGELVPLLPKGIPVVNLACRATLQDVLRLERYLLDEKPDMS